MDIPSAQEVTTNWLYRSAIMPTNNMVHEALIRPTSATSQITPKCYYQARPQFVIATWLVLRPVNAGAPPSTTTIEDMLPLSRSHRVGSG